MKLREFWVWPDHNAIKNVGEYLTMTPSNKVNPIHVREVCPEIDVAYAQCEKALEEIANRNDRDVLAALRKARGE